MAEDATKPTLDQFKDACRREFAFLRELGYSEREAEPDDPFTVRFSNGVLTLAIRGENWGAHAGVRLTDADGREAPVWWFVPIAALTMARHCREVLAGDTARFDAVAREWRRATDPQYRQSLQKRRLP